ncbi:glutamine amidotransferase [Telmatospirillum siberiense]|uniref:Glutamine amidotransferase n=1 Tax=Telmatospirillum siberiense TaxID=382514 RepID=A0A2N3PWH6_9PROT|nr:glutamine amidotransferase [Telmatospirillum siberiense]PKU24759.1 glutamine amidotransferase [Telmatospirillum siberiense]
MKTAIAIRHVQFEDLGLLGPILWRAGYQVAYRDAGIDPLDLHDLAATDLLVVLGGPLGAYDDQAYPFLADEIAAVYHRLERDRPTLGICLGAQIIARALGKRVYPSGTKELGWAPVELTDIGRASVLAPLDGLPVLHWHGDTFDLPDEIQHLARTKAVPNQAFALGDFGLALQFHLEADPLQLERWYIGHAAEISATPGIDVPALRAQAAQYAQALVPVAERIFTDWVNGLPPARVPSTPS